MTKSNLPEWNIFRRIIESEKSIVACFDIMMTRQRISSCKKTQELRNLGNALTKIARDAYEEVTSLSRTCTEGSSIFRTVSIPQDYSSCVKIILLQDTLIVIFDLQRAVRKSMKIDINIGTFFLFTLEAVDNIFDSLLEKGYLVKAAISSGSLYYKSNQVLGTSFINAWDSVEGVSKSSFMGIEVCDEFLRFQNWINCYLSHIHCAVGEYLFAHWYIPYNGKIYVNPIIPNRRSMERRLAMLQINGCNESYMLSTANFYIEVFKRTAEETWNAETESILENLKYLDWHHLKEDVISEFRIYRRLKRAMQSGNEDIK